MSAQVEELVRVVLGLAEFELESRQTLMKSGVLPGSEINHLRAALDSVRPLLLAAPSLLDALKMFCIDHTVPCGCGNCAVIRSAEGRKP